MVGKVERNNAKVEISTGLIFRFLVFLHVTLFIMKICLARCFDRLQRLHLQGSVNLKVSVVTSVQESTVHLAT